MLPPTTTLPRRANRCRSWRGGYLPNPWAAHAPYTTNTPTSGPRLHGLARWGVHSAPVQLALQVHNLEHGGVMLQYNRQRPCPELAERLEGLALGRPVIVAPYPYSGSRITLTGWGSLLKLEDWDEPRITRFIQSHAATDRHGRL